eukprot:TRINITY_DN22688_c0_g1_i1.p1 TRINITY_DN22688_c0_g1~~TRINITY_DN22688_c0_g1_i1.p1  ORF type:complete len:547 (+),score=51.14 TRINITY_DN22688_c0_g1_i1:99-1739(+)
MVVCSIRKEILVSLVAAVIVAVPWLHQQLRRHQRAHAQGIQPGGGGSGSRRGYPLSKQQPVAPPPQLARPTPSPPTPPPHPRSRVAMLGHAGAKCDQEPSCSFFSDVLVLLHANPARLEWVDPLVKLLTRFVPNLVLFTLIHPRSVSLNASAWRDHAFVGAGGFIPFEQRNAALDYLYVGANRTRIYLVDTRGQSWGDHHEVSVAARLWPGYAGYLSLQDDDCFPAWHWLGNPERGLNKSRVWSLKADRMWPLAPRRCNRQSGIKGRRCKVNPRTVALYRQPDPTTRISAVKGMVNGKLPPAVMQNFETYRALTPLYYVPSSALPAWRTLSEAMLREELFLEYATPSMLYAVAGPDGPQLLMGLNYMPNTCGQHKQCRYLYRTQWGQLVTGRQDFLHPTRAPGELNARIQFWLDRGNQLANISESSLQEFWAACITCEEYPFSHWARKGRFHSCEPGCAPGAAKRENPTAATGNVTPRGKPGLPPGEVEHEGFWGWEMVLLVFSQLYDQVNNSVGWPANLPRTPPPSAPPPAGRTGESAPANSTVR